MGVSQVTAPGEQIKWSPRSTFLPLVTAGQRPIFLDDTNALLLLLSTNFDSRKVVLLPLSTGGLVTVTNRTQAAIISPQVSAERLEFKVEASGPSLVVIAQTYYHHWRAYVDGRPQKLLRANYAFQALETPAGTHQVRLEYRDHAFQGGALVSGFTLLGCLGWWVRCGKPAKRSVGVAAG
jgi:hypothetical protein